MMKNLRQSRKNHSTGREAVKQVSHCPDIRGTETRDGSVLRDREFQFMEHSDPKYVFPTTPRPKSNERPTNGGVEGKKRGRQSDKSSRGRK